jgi:hypothetical protein
MKRTQFIPFAVLTVGLVAKNGAKRAMPGFAAAAAPRAARLIGWSRHILPPPPPSPSRGVRRRATERSNGGVTSRAAGGTTMATGPIDVTPRHARHLSRRESDASDSDDAAALSPGARERDSARQVADAIARAVAGDGAAVAGAPGHAPQPAPPPLQAGSVLLSPTLVATPAHGRAHPRSGKPGTPSARRCAESRNRIGGAPVGGRGRVGVIHTHASLRLPAQVQL